LCSQQILQSLEGRREQRRLYLLHRRRTEDTPVLLGQERTDMMNIKNWGLLSLQSLSKRLTSRPSTNATTK